LSMYACWSTSCWLFSMLGGLLEGRGLWAAEDCGGREERWGGAHDPEWRRQANEVGVAGDGMTEQAEWACR
jgi:hypothetical protein